MEYRGQQGHCPGVQQFKMKATLFNRSELVSETFYEKDGNAAVELICFPREKSLHTFRRLMKKNLFKNSMHPFLANAQGGASLDRFLHSTHGVIFKFLIGSCSRLHFEQFK